MDIKTKTSVRRTNNTPNLLVSGNRKAIALIRIGIILDRLQTIKIKNGKGYDYAILEKK